MSCSIKWTLLASLLVACVPESAPPPTSGEPVDEWDEKLAERETDFNAALRVAALRLTGELPTLVEIERVANAGDLAAQRAAYENEIRTYIASPKFKRQMFRFAQDTLRMGDDPNDPNGLVNQGGPPLDTAPALFAQVIVDNRSYMDLLTATSGTCPTYDATTNTFTPGECNNGVTIHAGLLTHPGMHAHFFGNLAFRRVRWVQETFACTKFPAEMAETPMDIGGAMPYTGKFAFTSIAGKASGGRVDFRSTTSVICANCHSNMNHIAPLLATFDRTGQYRGTFSVPVPLPDEPNVELRDYLPAGETFAWRFGVTVTDINSLGLAMAADPDVAECAVARIWNWALGKSDVVDGGARVPRTTIDDQVVAFVAGGHRLRDAIYRVFTSDDFVQF